MCIEQVKQAIDITFFAIQDTLKHSQRPTKLWKPAWRDKHAHRDLERQEYHRDKARVEFAVFKGELFFSPRPI